ncbi:uncharacterized protein [Littorina saxatilis]|uniref:uncharacterized protein n=1 Tax=Littorina saxatilis TaxID=31220 RepID=UPI0038B49255
MTTLTVKNRRVMEYSRPPVDRFFTGEIQNHLFQDGTGNSVDLIAFNIQRGRDHGLPAYNSWRRFCGLRAASSFNNMPDHDRFTSQRFSQVYRHVDDIDVFSGGISERAEGGGLVGPLFACILSQQFSNLKFGDRFWFETSDQNTGFTPDQLDQIRKHSLPRVLCDVTAITRIQPNPFRQVSLGNPLMNCQDVPEMNLMLWQEGGRGFLSTALWGEWSNWSQCKDGVQSRVRSCSQAGGRACAADRDRTRVAATTWAGPCNGPSGPCGSSASRASRGVHVCVKVWATLALGPRRTSEFAVGGRAATHVTWPGAPGAPSAIYPLQAGPSGPRGHVTASKASSGGDARATLTGVGGAWDRAPRHVPVATPTTTATEVGAPSPITALTSVIILACRRCVKDANKQTNKQTLFDPLFLFFLAYQKLSYNLHVKHTNTYD